jgi:NADH-quinone oxidoreductase subunit H
MGFEIDWFYLGSKAALCVVVLFGILNLSGLLGWVERKQSAVMQDRIGANRASVLGIRAIGLFHPVADAIKAITKEDFVPPEGDRRLHFMAPVISLFTVLMAYSVIPFGDRVMIAGREVDLLIADLDVGFLFVFAVMSLGVYGVVLAGAASGNKYALLGSMRGAAQMIAYEVTLGLTVLGICLIFDSLRLSEIVRSQGDLLWGWVPKWGVVLQPVAFILFVVAVAAESRRIPFDTPEGESEIVGYFLEYSGMKFLVFWMSEFVAIIVAAGLITTFFFGGWQVPYLVSDGFHFPWGMIWSLPHWFVAMLQVGAFVFKVLFFLWFLMTVRWTFPRFRFDQVLALGWKNILPLALFNLFATGLVMALVM